MYPNEQNVYWTEFRMTPPAVPGFLLGGPAVGLRLANRERTLERVNQIKLQAVEPRFHLTRFESLN